MKKSITRELKKYLKSLNEVELREEVLKLYNRLPIVKKYYLSELGENPEQILKDYKEKVINEYFPLRGIGRGRSSESKKIIDEFKRIAVHKKDVIELLLCRVDNMISFCTSYGFDSESLLNSIISTYREACHMICHEKLEDYFVKECDRLTEETSNIGWGVYEEMRDIYINTVAPDDSF